jgi:hypothetical protein
MVVLSAHPREWAIRVAAYNVVLADEKAAAEAAARQKSTKKA